MAIDGRKIRILEAIINDYINTGEPVGSRTIAKKYDLGVGSATIRNEMSDLEDMGYLEQPHTSAGRIPSSKGYRLYVDNLMQTARLSEEEELQIKKYIIDSAMLEVDKIVKQASTLLSELTNLTCIVQTPSVSRSCIKSVQLLMVDDHNLVSVIVTDNGLIKNHRIRVNKMPSIEELQKINLVINNRLKNLNIEEINLEVISNLKGDFEGYDDLFNAIVPVLYETLKNEEESSEIFMEGTTNIFNYPEYNDINNAKEILNLLYNKDYVVELLEPKEGLSIKIGDENYIPEAKNCSVISAEYSVGNKPIGTIGLIGPRRINYSRVISIMAQVMKELNYALKNQGLE
ncbi:MAG: heat-inducible transcriptional repressor HrcA [Clostridiaceae bacterium]|nr:heat-inducible transcriptional repressor HrcA [Clostridiaceae bacterium]